MVSQRTNRILFVGALLLLWAHVLLTLALPSEYARTTASNLIQLGACLLAGVACVAVARGSAGFARHFWWLVAASMAAWAIAQGFWTWYDLFDTPDQIRARTDVLFFFAYTPIALTLLMEIDPERRRIDWERTLDLVQFGIVLFAAYMYFFYMPHPEAPQQLAWRRLGILFNARNAFLIIGSLLRATLSRSRQVRELFMRLSAFLFAYAICTGLANLARFQWDAGSGHWSSAGWTMGFTVLTIVVLTWRQQEPEPVIERIPNVRTVLSVHLLPTLIPFTVLFLSSQILKEQTVLASLLMLFSFACYSLRLAVSQDKQRRAVTALRETEGRFRLLFAANPHPMWVVDLETLRFLEVNDAAVRRYGYSRDEFLSMRLTQIRPPDEVPKLLESLADETGIREFGVWKHACKNGEIVTVEIHAEPIQFAGHNAMLVLSQDLTERQRLEEQLRQSQKMEAVGTLAGGIAHDFNNLLTVIKGYSCLVLDRVKEDEQLAREVGQIEKAAEKAATLTRQLLAFSRRQVLQPRNINLNAIVASVDNMLRRVIGEHIEIVNRFAPDVGTVRADPSQIEQVILNLAVNARDAMPTGGRLTFTTSNVVIDEAFAREHLGIRPGRCVLLEVSDTGHGMDAETQRHIFEPFFTTKELGRGTGLGLSTVYGIVKQSEGYIAVESSPGAGATFRIYLPRVDQPVADGDPSESGTRRVGFETILLVEDEDVVRQLANRILVTSGYKVLLASRGDEAEKICIEYDGVIHLLITDVVMPGLSGHELVQKVAGKRPGMKVLYMSGYTDQALQGTDIKSGIAFLEKPFTPAALQRRVREVLEGRIIPSSATWVRGANG
ncbi:MAG TPA: ATP-binding protein [Terriglobales bacterium]|nr:ATP-binding protein [Terriglobales bacterium]